jgi:hypothetical protein
VEPLEALGTGDILVHGGDVVGGGGGGGVAPPDLRRRAAAWSIAVIEGRAAALWLDFIAPLRHLTPDDDDDIALEEETLLDYDTLPPISTSPTLPPPDVTARKTAYLAAHHEFSRAYRCHTPSASVDPRSREAKRTIIHHHPQVPHRPLTPAITADAPGVAPLSFTTHHVTRAAKSLSDLKAPGTLPEDNRIIKAIVAHGGAHAVASWTSSVAADRAHPIARDLLAGAARSALVGKFDPLDGTQCGTRPLGVVEKWACLVWACYFLVTRTALNHYFTRPPPADVARRQHDIDAAEAAVTAATVQLDAAVHSHAPPDRVGPLQTAVDAARSTLDSASRPLKFVTNWCFASKGCEKLASLVRAWTVLDPTSATASNDIASMYQNVSRAEGFEWLHSEFPSHKPLFRFFLGTPPVIWLGAERIPIHLPADGGPASLATLASNDGFLRSVEGGPQGLGASTPICVGPYHAQCILAQRLHPDANMAAVADDLYINGSPSLTRPPSAPPPGAPPGAPPLPPVFAALATYRDLCARNLNTHSNLSKSLIHSPTGDLSAAPPDIPGSPNYTTTDPSLSTSERDALITARRQPVLAFKVAGIYVGDDDTCSSLLLRTLQTKLSPLGRIASLADCQHVTNTRQLALLLLRMVASASPTYYMRGMPPHQTAAAAAWVDDAVSAAAATALRFADSPPDRRALAHLQLGLPIRVGGYALATFVETRHACYTSSTIACWPTCCAVLPALATLPISATSPSAPLRAFHSSWTRLHRLLASVRERHATLDRDTRVWVDGSVHTAFHPHIDPTFSLPADPAAVFATGSTSKCASRFSQRALAAIVNGDRWLRLQSTLADFDTANSHLASTRDRESARLISYSQPGAGARLTRPPDPTLHHSVVPSDEFTLDAQRRLGLYLSALTTPLDALAALGRPVTQHLRLGDHSINRAHHSHRHTIALRATFDAFRAVTPPQGRASFALCDRGDGTPSGTASARQRWAHVNAGHVPDFVRHGFPDHSYEYKCYTWAPTATSAALGLGSRQNGGAPSTSDGGSFALGNTEESLRALTLGLAERGTPGTRYDRRSGDGWVAATTDHHYADALSHGRPVTLLASESSGAISTAFDLALRLLDRQSRARGALDATRYGTSRVSHRRFYAHHLAAISAAIAHADAVSIFTDAAHRSHLLSLGLA